MRKCKHEVYFPEDIPGEQNPFCSGCTPIEKGIKPPRNLEETDSDEVIFNSCPICLSKEFHYESEDRYWCDNCGFTENDII